MASPKYIAPVVQASVMVKIRRDVTKVRRPGNQQGVGVLGVTTDAGNKVPDLLQGKWFCEMALARNLMIKDCTAAEVPHFTYHASLDVSVGKHEVLPTDLFVGKDGNLVDKPVYESALLEVEESRVLATDVLVK